MVQRKNVAKETVQVSPAVAEVVGRMSTINSKLQKSEAGFESNIADAHKNAKDISDGLELLEDYRNILTAAGISAPVETMAVVAGFASLSKAISDLKDAVGAMIPELTDTEAPLLARGVLAPRNEVVISKDNEPKITVNQVISAKATAAELDRIYNKAK